MSNQDYIEELLYEVHSLGKTNELYDKMDEIRNKNPRMSTYELIETAYNIIIK